MTEPTLVARKRLFDLLVVLLAAPIWLPVLLLCVAAVTVGSGFPVFYCSRRRVFAMRSLTVWKFRAMVPEADRVVNRDTVPVDKGQRFLNLPLDSPLYTGVGRWLEHCSLTELPQLFHVLSGKMNLVGNRPLPENVVAALKAKHPLVEERFMSRAGLTGPVQLVGRDKMDDEERLKLERLYCSLVQNSYTMELDFVILLYTVLHCLHIKRSMSREAVGDLMRRCARLHRGRRLVDQRSPSTGIEV